MQHLELSHQQRRAWQMRSDAVTIPRTEVEIGVSGPIDPERLAAAVGAVVHRHEILRTRIERQPGLNLPVQAIYESVAALSVARGTPGDAVDIQVVRESPDHARVTVRSPATLLDRFSCELLRDDLAKLYAGTSGEVTTEPLQYADYASWIDESMTAPDTERGRRFWSDLDLAPFDDFVLAVSKRNHDFTRAQSKSHKYFGGAAVDAVRRYAEARDVAIEVVIASAWLVLLYRHGITDQVAVGIGRSLRPFEDLRTGMGMYHQYLPLIAALEADHRFDDIVSLVSAYFAQMDEWQDCFSWDLLAADRPCCLRYLFDFSTAPSAIAGDGLTFSVERIESHSEPFELKLEVEQASDGSALGCTLWFDAASIEPRQAERFLPQLELLIVDALEEPIRSIGRLRMLPAEEKAVIERLNETFAPYALDSMTLVSFFRDAASKFADRDAVSFRNETFSYRELDARSNRVARMLISDHGVGQETIVAIMMERGVHLLPALYGVLKAGGAYLPLDPDYPDDRIRHILAEAKVRCVLCDRDYLPRLTALGVPAICLADFDLGPYSSDPLDVDIDPRSAAYVIYTSGSTGLPKGVQNEHRGICNLLCWMQDEYRLTADDRVLQKTPYTFDVSLPELFWPLHVGALVVFADPGGHRDAGYLVNVIRQERITTTSFVPTMLRLFLDHPEAGTCVSLTRILAAGEALVGDLRRRFRTTLPTTGLLNLYGPTEAAVYVTHWDCGPESPYGVVPIGRPLANTQIHVLDAELRPVPIGVKGELYIGGVQVARGYVGRDDLTRERFINDPFSSEGRLYKSGDLSRWLPDGSIAYLGRTDSQIKLRGLRIELGEIEEVISMHPDVAQCVVVVRELSDMDRRLVAYLIAAEGAALDIDAVRKHVASKVPDYMIPAHLQVVAEFPTTSSGKIDRKRLPDPDLKTAAAGYLAARNGVERYLVATWQDMLKIDRIGVRDNFFELGGDSLQAAIFCNHLSAVINGYVSVVAVFEHGTVEQFAKFLSGEYPAASDALVTTRTDDQPRPTGERLGPIPDRPTTLPATEYQVRTWLIDALEEKNPAYNTMVALELRGKIDVAALRRAIRHLIDRHEILRTRYHVADGRLFQSLCPVETTPFAVLSLQSPLSEQSIKRCVQEEAHRTFDLEAGEVIRATLYCGTDGASLLIVDVHQIASDAWCRDLLVQEITALYQAETAVEATPMPPVLQYGDFALWIRARSSGPDGERSREFWRKLLGERPEVLDLPTNALRPPVKTNHGALVRHTLPSSLLSRVYELAGAKRVSSFMVLFAGFFVLLAKYCGQKNIIVGSTVACREREETQLLMGRIANMIAVPATVDTEATFSELLAQVRDTLLGAYTHQDYPLTGVLAETAPVRDASQTTLYQVVFAGETKPRVIPKISGLDVRDVAVDKGLAKYDMTMVVMEDNHELLVELEYNTDVFIAASMHCLLDDYASLLDMLVDRSDSPLGTIELGAASDRLRHVGERPRINGFPIDIERLREALLALAPIEQCELRAHSADGRDALVAYYSGTKTDSDEIERMLAWSVPAFMLPSRYVYTADVGGSALAASTPEPRHAESGDRIEEQIIEEWRGLLAKTSIAPDDDFFDLGGNSMLALQAAGLAASTFGVPLTLRHFFEASKPRALARHVRVLRALTTPDTRTNIENVRI
jgi:amino acid adenylation domain-containing protein